MCRANIERRHLAIDKPKAQAELSTAAFNYLARACQAHSANDPIYFVIQE